MNIVEACLSIARHLTEKCIFLLENSSIKTLRREVSSKKCIKFCYKTSSLSPPFFLSTSPLYILTPRITNIFHSNHAKLLQRLLLIYILFYTYKQNNISAVSHSVRQAPRIHIKALAVKTATTIPTMGSSKTSVGHRSKRTTSHQAQKALTFQSFIHQLYHNLPATEHRKSSWTKEQLSDANFLKVPASVWKNIHDPTRTEWIDAAEDTLTSALAANALYPIPVMGLTRV